MTRVIEAKVTSQGVLIPRPLLTAWGEVEEVEIEQYSEFSTLCDVLRSDCLNEYQMIPPTVAVIDLACMLLARHPLRAYDTIHLATALSAQHFLAQRDLSHLTFVCADDNLNNAATVEGLAVNNPNSQP